MSDDLSLEMYNSSSRTLLKHFILSDPRKRQNNTTDNEYGISLSPEAAGIFIVLFSITTLTAIAGNVLAIVVFTKGRRCKTDLRPFLLNLAVADLIMAFFCIPFTFTNQLLRKWIFSPPTCPIVVFLQLTAVTASVFTNTAIGIDRFFAVAFPLRSRIIAKRHTIMICIIWTISIAFSVVQFKVTKARPNNDTLVLECVEDWNDETMNSRKSYTLLILFLTYIVPLTSLSITYSIVGCILFRRVLPGQVDQLRDQQQIKSTRKVVKMLVTIVTLFGLCWLPLHAFTLTLDYNPELLKYMDQLQIVYFVAHWIAMSNSFVNPIIYISMNSNFRHDLITLLCPARHRYESTSSKMMTQYWKENSTRNKVVKKTSLPVEYESGSEHHPSLKRKLDETRQKSCKAF